MSRVTVVGSGFAALTAVRALAKAGDTQVTLVSPQAEFQYLPGIIWIPSGLRRPEDLRLPLADFFRRLGVQHLAAAATGLSADGRVLETSAGPVENDGLIIASGGRFLKKLPGIEHAITPCEGIAAAERIRDRLRAMSGGTIALGFAGNPQEPQAMRGGPMFEFLFGIDRQLRQEGRRDCFKLIFFSPTDQPGNRLGLKAVAVYRDGCKRSQPLSTARDKAVLEQIGVAPTAVRRKLPDERESITHKFSIGGHEGYITVGKYEDGTAGEIFITMAKEGSTISGLMDSFATMTSLALQHGVPLQLLVDKFTHTRFEPSGFTRNPEIPMAKSIMDYIFKWLATKFLARDAQEHAGVILRDDVAPAGPQASVPANVTTPSASDLSFIDKVTTAAPATVAADSTKVMGFVMPAKNADGANPTKTGTFLYQQDAPSCSDCGEIMVRNGACYKCLNCGSTSGCS